MTWCHRSPAVDRRRRPRKTRAAHRSPAARRRSSGSGQSQPQTTASRRCRRASTCSPSPAAFRLTLAAGRFISGAFMGAGYCGNRSDGRVFDYTQASRPDLVPMTGWTSSDAAGCREAAPHSRPHNVKSDAIHSFTTSACVFQNKLESLLYWTWTDTRKTAYTTLIYTPAICINIPKHNSKAIQSFVFNSMSIFPENWVNFILKEKKSASCLFPIRNETQNKSIFQKH